MNRWCSTAAVVVVCVVMLAGCGTDTASIPVAPSGPGNAFELSGRVSNSVTGNPVAGAQISVRGATVRAASGADGAYSILGDTGVQLEVVAEAAGYWTRRMAVSPADKTVDIDLLPQGDGFDLKFFDRVMRSGGVTRRLTATPTFTIFTQLFECVVPADPVSGCSTDRRCGGRDTRVGVGDDVDESLVAETRAVIEQDLSKYTGGFLHDPVIRMGERLRAGSVVNFNTLRAPDDIAFLFVEKVGCAGTADGIGTTGQIIIKPSAVSGPWRDFRRGTISHEMAHMLGFDHADASMVVCSIMGGSCSNPALLGRPSPADMLHGRILYKRPRGNSSPDTNWNR